MKRRTTGFILTVLSILFTMNAFSQSPIKTYDKEWKKVEEFVKKNLPKSALPEVKKIYALAKKEKQDAQIIKSLIYLSSLQEETREDNQQLTIKEWEKEIPLTPEPARSIIKSYLAELYYFHFANIRWQLYNRTATTNFVKEDINTWGAEDFHRKISEYYLASLSNPGQLQKTDLKPYDAIINKGNARNLRPTLYDLLAHKALQYFSTGERDLERPSYAFEIDHASAFDPAADFIHRKFPTKDSASLEHKALLLYQQLVAFHINDSKPDALIDVDLARLGYVRSKSVHPDKDQLYFNAINHIAHQYENLPAASMAWYQVATYYQQKGDSYKPYEDSTHRLALTRAKEIAERISAQPGTSEGKVYAENLLAQLKRQELNFSVEKVNIPDQPFRAFVTYRNVPVSYFRVIAATDELLDLLEKRNTENYWKKLVAATPLKAWEQSLPASNDLQSHSAEVKIDGLPVGQYLLVASTSKEFSATTTQLSAKLIHISSIAYVNRGLDYFVLDRNTGNPLASAKVQVWENKYDEKKYVYNLVKEKTYTTDKNGFFRKAKSEKSERNYYNNNYTVEITHGKDRLFIKELEYEYYYNPNQEENIPSKTNVFFFTDRSLYRPGQQVYFKGIALRKEKGSRHSQIHTSFKTKVYLQDVNDQNIDSLTLTTNEYGTFSGTFQLPANGLTGAFSISIPENAGYSSFNVEEYKRPKFLVEYEKVAATYKVNEKVLVTGTAKAYAGNNIDGANVKYRVTRQARFIYPWLYRKSWLPQTQPQEIAHGELKTDKDGKFRIEFTAIPDNTVDPKTDPVFDYVVYADVTDINGETRSGETTVSVSYKSLLLKTSIPDRLSIDSLTSLSITTENTNGVFQPSDVRVTFSKLKTETRLIRDRLWNRPDQFVMSKEEYVRTFPTDEYDNETEISNWAVGEKVFDKTDSTKNNGTWKVAADKWEPGFYRVEISTRDKFGQEVKTVEYLELFDQKKNELNKPAYLWSQGSTAVEPGQTSYVRLATSANVPFLVKVEDKSADRDNSNYSFGKLDKGVTSFAFTPTENDRGGWGAGWMFISNNRVYSYTQTIVVPWTNKQLDIEYGTYRDKTLPGSTEKWTLKIKGYKGEKVAAEMLASMYDASLDQFYPHQWSLPDLWPSYPGLSQFNTRQNFGVFNSGWIKSYSQPWKSFDKRYDELLSVENNQRHMRLPNQYMKAQAAPMARGEVAIAYDTIAAGGIETLGNTDLSYKFSTSIATTSQGNETQIRRNFNETAFFFPQLRTDAEGSLEFSFTLPEALTRWKFQAIAHTKDLAMGYSSKEIVTQKQLMVQPNPPRFFREGDKIEFSAKIANLTEKELTGQATIAFSDAATGLPLDSRFHVIVPQQYFTIAPGQSEAVQFAVEIPFQFDKAVTWRVVAKAENFSDGEEASIPVLSNRMLVTESLPINVTGSGNKNFTFDKLLQSGSSETLQNHALTVEYTSNPAWYAVQALPYLMEYPYECAEQTWNRYYANSLGSMLANSSPRIKAIFEKWRTLDTAALISNLQKNQELKSLLLEETPWVLEAKSEAEQKRNLALLFDMVKMSNQLNSSYEKLKQKQLSNGGFAWFDGGPDDRYITQYILTGLGHLNKLKAVAPGQADKLKAIADAALPYLDRKIKESYDQLVKNKVNLSKYTPGFNEIQYLYMRSFFSNYKIPAASQKAVTYFKSRLPLSWTSMNKYMQGMTALVLHRSGEKKVTANILASLRETSIVNEELGRYWKDATRGWWWYEAPVERQALLIEAFQEAGNDKKTADELRTWLLKNKQTNKWESTKATAEACYALLIQGTDWLSGEPVVTIKLGNTTISSTDDVTEAGTGYFKKTIEGEKVNPTMGNISVIVQQPAASNASSWGSVYWQYFEDLDKITTAATPLRLVKKLFVEKNSDRGPVLTPVNDGDYLKVGDKVKVRIELRVDRDMEYVHMKDMRAAALEPVNVLSGYKWQGGLGYYESTRDASTNFFFNQLRKGTYVFEYPVFVTHSGNFSNGVTTIQCMYAPEFTAHSKGIRINVDQQ